ncbi:sensor histidine kinase [Thioalkalivibrio thiocyanodenitrificans]|uniref:sensor histidine kinase n=1 Tax=Thioalkalivibrio thiocyanodenitrificans TaxID=243063 RepID=UPI000379510E|nr:HAMP domain-containing sensor histidine kinase [Thioalkalivibrio thiocyanodenitrificans]
MRLRKLNLVSRLVLILVSGLLVTQLAAGIILLRDRGEVMYKAGGLYAAQRISTIVHTLEALSPQASELVIDAINGPSLAVSITSTGPPTPLPARNRDSARDHEGHLWSLLARALGAPRNIVVTMHGVQGDTLPLGGNGAFPEELDRGFSAWVELMDGRWVRFDHRLGVEIYAVPRRLVLTLIVLLVPVVLLSWIAVHRVTRPLQMLLEAAGELTKDIQRPALPETGPPEVQDAASAFNSMQAHLARMIRDREFLLGAISHDLRTPITKLRLRAELVEDSELRSRIGRDIDQIEQLASAMLEFTCGVSVGDSVQPVDIMALLESIQHDREELGQRVRVVGGAEVHHVRPGALRRCVENLVDNAVKYGGEATIDVSHNVGQLVIRVSDPGGGIPEPLLERVFDPFYRVEESRSRTTGGIGLGLAIARNIARSHGGELTLRNHEGGGLEAVVTLP